MRFSLLFSRSIFLFFFGCLPFIGNTRNLPESKVDPIVVAEQLIEDGSINIAYLILVEHLKTKNLSKEVKYKVYKDLAKIHLYEQDLVNYEKLNRKAYELKKNEGEIYKGMYYAEKAYFWHFLMWSDSAAYYSNRSMEIIQRNRKDIAQINIAFVYQMYGIGYLYRKVDPLIKVKVNHDLPVSRILMNQYFDSAKIYEQKFPFQFSSDRVMLYRGVGNRYLDLVSEYTYNYKDFQKTMNQQQWFSYRKAMESYDYTKKHVLNSLNWNDIIFTNSMKGLNYMCIGERKKARILFNTVLNNYLKVYKSFENSPNLQALLILYSYKIINDESLPYDDKQTKKDINILKKLRNIWWAYFIQSDGYNYDTYSSSPNFYIYKLYLRRYFNTSKKIDLQCASNYLFSEILNFHFIDKYNLKYNNRENNAYSEFNKLGDRKLKTTILQLVEFHHKKIIKAPKVSISLIQKRLKEGECFMFSCSRKTFDDSYKMIITKDNVSIVKSKNDINYRWIDYDTIDFKSFKQLSYNQYVVKFKDVLKLNKSIKKVYVMYYDYSNYSMMIKDTLGKNYDQLNYLGKKIQFVTVYDPYDFFTKKKKNNKCQLQFVKLNNKQFSNLPFIDQLSCSNFGKLPVKQSTFKGKLSDFLLSKGILHLYGHGSLISNNDSGTKNIELPYQSNSTDSSISKINSDQIVNSSLVVLNNCYSGYNTNISTREFDRGIYLNLLNKGALNVIVSPIKTDDESSSKIFRFFYKNIAKGETTNDALYHAQLTYLSMNKGSLAHPKFWAPYRLISNYRFPIYENKEPKTKDSSYFLIFLLVVIILISIRLYVQMKRF